MKLNYIKVGDYYLPEVYIPSERISRLELGKYGRARLKFLINKMAKEEQIDEQLKEQNQMKWVGLMNNIKCTAVDTVMRKIVCR